MKLRWFQREDVDLIKDHGLRALIASEPGTGKTLVAIVALLETASKSLPAVIVCPASVTRNWAREFKKWAPGIEIVIIDDMSSRMEKRSSHRNIVYIVSWALLDSRWVDLRNIGMRTIVADEAHAVKNPTTQRARALQRLVPHARGVLLLTGTPIVNNTSELTELKMLLGSSDPLMIRRLIHEVAPDVPPKRRAYLPVQLRPKDRAEYDRADEDFETWLATEKGLRQNDGMSDYDINRALAAEALVKIGYLRRLVGEMKVPAAAEWICRAVRVGEPVVVFVEHQEVLNRLSKLLFRARIRHGVLDGNTSPKDRQRVIDDFQKRRFPVFIGTQAAKEGITLTAARHTLFLERFFTSVIEDQEEDRTHRISQTSVTTMWYLHAEDTVDERIDTIVGDKRTLITEAIGAGDVEETTLGNTEALLASWSKHTKKNRGKTLSLGLGDMPDPLPSPRDAYAVVFRGSRWDPNSAVQWCRMNGFRPSRRVDLQGRLKLIINPTTLFRPNSFKAVDVSKDIRVLIGKRLSSRVTKQLERSWRR